MSPRYPQNILILSSDRNGFFLGAPFTAAIFLIPQRFILVNGLSPLDAGVRLLPFTFLCPIGSIIASVIAKAKVPTIYLLVVGSVLQVVGFALLTTIPITTDIWSPQYGFQIIAGFGVGINISTLILMTPFCVEDRDKGMSNSLTCFALFLPFPFLFYRVSMI